MEYREAIDFLYSLRLFGTKLGLENTFALAKLCGNPHEKLRFIHVAGTNGKGSVCAMLESVYRQAGLRTGLFTSPHLISFTERIQVNRQNIAESDVARLVEELLKRVGCRDIEEWPFRPTFFEFVTVMALVYFVEQRCDLVIWETGMGGRLDATNIVTPLLSIITNIQRDHQQWLGETLSQIAQEKAGIIKPGVPVITATDSDESLEVIRSTAAERQSPFQHVTSRLHEVQLAQQVLSLRGEHQKINASLVLTAVEQLQKRIPVSAEALSNGLAQTSWPGRLQLLHIGSSQILLDGAHNPDGAEALVQALGDLFPRAEITLIIGLFSDKRWQEMCSILIPRASRVWIVPLHSERSADPAVVLQYCRERWPQIPVEAEGSTGRAVDRALGDQFVVIAGSLHLIGEVMEHLHLLPLMSSERELNEWDAARRQ